MKHKLQLITPNLWFDNQAEEAALFYTSIFPDSEISMITRFGKEGFESHGKPEGSVMTVEFTLDGQQFVALNGGPAFPFSPAVSFIINCENQEEVDYYWNTLAEGGAPEAQMCGWLADKYGVSWQVVPTILTEMLNDADQAKAERVTKAMLEMKKLDISALKQAYQGEVIP